MKTECYCAKCQWPMHRQKKGKHGQWVCLNPHRGELDDKGNFTVPYNETPDIVICVTPVDDYGDREAHRQALAEATIPVWCYYWAVEREKAKDPAFNPCQRRDEVYKKRGRPRKRPFFYTEASIDRQERNGIE